MELRAEEAAGRGGGGGEGGAVAGGDGAEAGRQGGHAVAMAHPDLLARALAPDAGGERAFLLDIDEGAAEFAVVMPLDAAAELEAHGLLAVADAQDRQAHVED